MQNYLLPRLRRKRIFWGWTWTGSLPLIEDNGRFSRMSIVFSGCITYDNGHQRWPSLKNVSFDTQRSKGLLAFCPDTIIEHHTHRGICKQLAQVCWDSQRLSRSRCCEDANTRSRVIRKRKTVVVHRVIISPLTSMYGKSEVRTTSREPAPTFVIYERILWHSAEMTSR